MQAHWFPQSMRVNPNRTQPCTCHAIYVEQPTEKILRENFFTNKTFGRLNPNMLWFSDRV
jgi:hypothetical protein